MKRLQHRSLVASLRMPTLSPARQTLSIAASASRATACTRRSTYSTTSSPKSAEGPSAESGGSRSKEAAETGSSPTAGGVMPDPLADGDARGRTGGGRPLESSRAAPAQPKITNASVPGARPNLTEEQKAEVDAHNRDFESKHGKAERAEDDKVDKSFWSGKGSRYNKE